MLKTIIAALFGASVFAASIGAFFDDLKMITKVLAPIEQVLSRSAH